MRKNIFEVNAMIILNVEIDNFYAFRNFKMNLSYPKKIVGSYIVEEHLQNHPNFRYKKVNIIMGGNASGKTTLGYMICNIFNFIEKKNYATVTDEIGDTSRPASFLVDLVSATDNMYRIHCLIHPMRGEEYTSEDVEVRVDAIAIGPKDSYESCVKKIKKQEASHCDSYIEELEKIEPLYWLFKHPNDTRSVISFPKDDAKFPKVLEIILKALDPGIQKVEPVAEVEDAYVVRMNNKSVILQNGDFLATELLSSGTKSGVEVAGFVSKLINGRHSFYYCDEKFSFIHSDIEKAILSLMIDSIKPNNQLFFTTHNTDVLDMNLPKHAFSFLKKDVVDEEHPIVCLNAGDYLKRNTDSLRKAVENDLFSMAPATERIFDIADL